MNSASKFNSIVDKRLKPVLCSSRDSVPLKFKKQTWRQYSSIISVPHSKSGVVPMLLLSGVGQLGFWEVGKGGTIG